MFRTRKRPATTEKQETDMTINPPSGYPYPEWADDPADDFHVSEHLRGHYAEQPDRPRLNDPAANPGSQGMAWNSGAWKVMAEVYPPRHGYTLDRQDSGYEHQARDLRPTYVTGLHDPAAARTWSVHQARMRAAEGARILAEKQQAEYDNRPTCSICGTRDEPGARIQRDRWQVPGTWGTWREVNACPTCRTALPAAVTEVASTLPTYTTVLAYVTAETSKVHTP